MKRIKLLLIATILSISVLLAGCSTGNTADPSINEEKVDFTVEMQNFKFTPNIIEANAGETIKIKLLSVDNNHDFVIDELGIQSANLGRNKSEIIEIQIPDNVSGQSFEFYCSIGDHEAMGMKGTLKVK